MLVIGIIYNFYLIYQQAAIYIQLKLLNETIL